MRNSIVLKTLNILKQRLNNENNKLIVQNEQGNTSVVTCSFNLPVEQKDIEVFENNTGWTIPLDYKTFLQQHNGARIFEMLLEGNINIGGGIRVFSLDEIKITHSNLQLPKNIYPIAHLHEVYLLVDNERVINGNLNYLILTDDALGLHYLQYNFEVFLDRFVVSQGSNFWRWNISAMETYYNIHEIE
ncbi:MULTISPECIES: SMI1/KNR4 family protein [Bacillus cereus group]|uniref:SMI1/KNR4 family protein n=1 Tax=Bacillus cereus TaxID=1396 RepID=A0A9W7QK18_BACCE|nr:SMI1/KNR4 family protein [Bacillus cereus]KAB2399843.1 SMI1/KNR4 family protein [Bacillus cereus]KAB2410615.1 SMI1/KNR4 family protein [Bacillus cereus]KAB2431851.1 SMI1/KNR4 family protein [Bacillus cereus]